MIRGKRLAYSKRWRYLLHFEFQRELKNLVGTLETDREL